MLLAPATTFTELLYVSGTAALLEAAVLGFAADCARSIILTISPARSISNLPRPRGRNSMRSMMPRRISAASVRLACKKPPSTAIDVHQLVLTESTGHEIGLRIQIVYTALPGNRHLAGPPTCRITQFVAALLLR